LKHYKTDFGDLETSIRQLVGVLEGHKTLWPVSLPTLASKIIANGVQPTKTPVTKRDRNANVLSSRLVLKLADGATSDSTKAGRECKASVECTRHEAGPKERLGTGLMSASAILQNVGFRRIGLTDRR
jgi:hypothetical protein